MSTLHEDLLNFLDANEAADESVIAAGVGAILSARPMSTIMTSSSVGGEMMGTPPDTNIVASQAAAGFSFEHFRI